VYVYRTFDLIDLGTEGEGTMTSTANSGPLDGIRVLSSEVQVAGPYCTVTLADRGADVIKVERPKYGDSAREGAPMLHNDAGERVSGYFMRFNRNKRSITLNLRESQGKDIYKELAKKSDVVIDNLRPGALNKLGLGYQDLKPLNPGLIYVSISGFGTMPELKGIYSGRPAYDIVAQAMVRHRGAGHGWSDVHLWARGRTSHLVGDRVGRPLLGCLGC
jgi:crotonobetainyl-CoA:carnitine CoA-transferase CaiB-like acyl-CoA transferase